MIAEVTTDNMMRRAGSGCRQHLAQIARSMGGQVDTKMGTARNTAQSICLCAVNAMTAVWSVAPVTAVVLDCVTDAKSRMKTDLAMLCTVKVAGSN